MNGTERHLKDLVYFDSIFTEHDEEWETLMSGVHCHLMYIEKLYFYPGKLERMLALSFERSFPKSIKIQFSSRRGFKFPVKRCKDLRRTLDETVWQLEYALYLNRRKLRNFKEPKLLTSIGSIASLIELCSVNRIDVMSLIESVYKAVCEDEPLYIIGGDSAFTMYLTLLNVVGTDYIFYNSVPRKKCNAYSLRENFRNFNMTKLSWVYQLFLFTRFIDSDETTLSVSLLTKDLNFLSL